MTYDDGIVGVYDLTQIKEPGRMPIDGLALRDRFFFGYDTLGINRYYVAMQAGKQIEAVINIPGWHPMPPNRTLAIIADEDGVIDSTMPQYRIVMVQPTLDEDGLRMTKLSLERISETYAVMS